MIDGFSDILITLHYVHSMGNLGIWLSVAGCLNIKSFQAFLLSVDDGTMIFY